MVLIAVWKLDGWPRYASCSVCGMNVRLGILKLARRWLINWDPNWSKLSLNVSLEWSWLFYWFYVSFPLLLGWVFFLVWTVYLGCVSLCFLIRLCYIWKKVYIGTSNGKKLKNIFDDINSYLPMGRFLFQKLIYWLIHLLTIYILDFCFSGKNISNDCEVLVFRRFNLSDNVS